MAADLFMLLQDLGDRIANKGDVSGSTQHDEDDAVESRFRSVLPALLERSFVPIKAKERELLASLKLLCMMVKHFPGVFHNGKAQSVLPILSRVIPLFAEWDLRACHERLFDTWSAFMLLLKAGDFETYQRIFMDGMLLLEDLVSIASFYSSGHPVTSGAEVSVECFATSFSKLSRDGPADGRSDGFWKLQVAEVLVIKVTGEGSWQPLAEWVIRLLGRCLEAEPLHLEGLLSGSFISEIATIFCFGNSSLHMIRSLFDHTAHCFIEGLL